jgi:hypothetical protein
MLSTAGLLHLVTAAVGFACLVAARFVLAHRLARRGRTRRAWYSRATGLVFLAGFVGTASGSSSPAVVLGFWFAVVVAWAWLAALSVHLYRYRATPHPDRPRAAGDDERLQRHTGASPRPRRWRPDPLRLGVSWPRQRRPRPPPAGWRGRPGHAAMVARLSRPESLIWA